MDTMVMGYPQIKDEQSDKSFCDMSKVMLADLGIKLSLSDFMFNMFSNKNSSCFYQCTIIENLIMH